MDFKSQVAADIPAVFLNTAEFGELHTIDVGHGGYPVACVIDDEARSGDGRGIGGRTAEGVYVSEFVVHVEKETLTNAPVKDQRIVVDEKPANVIHVVEAMGMLSIRCQWYES